MNKIFWSSAMLALTLFVSACGNATNSSNTPLFVPAVDYADFTPAPGCAADVPDATYRACIDPRALYAAAIESAQAADNPLMVIWGFEECPYCKKFAAEEMNPENPRTIADFVTNTLSDTQRESLPRAC